MRRPPPLAALGAAAVLSLTACGGTSTPSGAGSGSGTQGSPGAGSVTTTAPAGPTSPDSTPASITGIVTHRDGRLVSGALVSVTSRDGLPVPELAVLTGEDGRYAWPGLRPGRYAVRVSIPGSTLVGSSEATVPTTGTATADVQVSDG